MEVAARKTILSPGDMLGCYRIENFLGQGGFGVTYLALDTKLDLQVAIKEYMPEQIAERTHDNSVQPKSPSEHTTFSWGLSRFIKEARTLAKFKHPNIVRVMAVFEQNGTAYMVMEYERGQDLKGLLANSAINTEQQLKKIIAPVIDGLAEVHRHGYIHRDIKPANILVRHDGSPVLLDFGSARLATGAQTQALTALVSVGYAPLEQYNEANDNQQGPWTDVYALGAVLYFAITGNPPVDSTLRGSAVLNDRPDPLTALTQLTPEGFTVAFCQAIDWALSFKVKDRPQSLEQWRSRLLSEDATVLMPTTFTPSSDAPHRSTPENTARNQKFNVQTEKQPRQTSQRRRLDDPDFDSDSTPVSDVQVSNHRAPVEPDHEWETQSERKQRESAYAATQVPTTVKSRVLRNTAVTVFLAALILVPSIILKDRWLPGSGNAQELANAQATQAKALEQAAEVAAQNAEAQALREREAQAAREVQQRELEAAEAAEAARLRQAERDAQAAANQQALEQAQRAAEQAAQREQQRIDKANAAKAAELAAAEKRAEEEMQSSEPVAILGTPETIIEPTVDPALPITDADISQVLSQFNALRGAISRKDPTQLRNLTFESARKYAYFDYLFKSFESIEISLGGIQASRLDQTVRAELRVTRMRRSNGDIAFPPDEFKRIPIHSVRSKEWSKIHW